ncbi:MAG: hypothetical protein DRN49_05060 [Thaumarchaeota archaeon]|nr:MAG: hypothetical protein DRN49_05060 [Nitrososphaerota archaeon]
MLEALVSFLAVIMATPFMIRLGKRVGMVGVDVHKSSKPIIPKTGGLALILGSSIALLIHMIFNWEFSSLIFLSTGLIAGFIGFLEDLKGELNPKLKPVLLLLASIPILITGSYTPRPVIPFIGRTRLYKVYPILVALAYPITCNAVNSVDVLNGSMIYTSIPFFIMSLIIAYLRGDGFILTMSMICLSILIALIPYNRYPARIFPGNSGSLFIGGLMTSIAIIGRMEVAAIIALLPQIMNEMHVIFSIGGIRSAKEVRSRPVKFIDGFLTASKDRDAPITLVRLLSARAKVSERTMAYMMGTLTMFTAILAILTDILLVEVWI